MVTVKTKEELLRAIETGETEIKVESKDLQTACYLANKYQSLESAFMALFKKTIGIGTPTCNIVIDNAVVITVTILICMTALSIIAMIKEYDLNIDFKNFTLKIYKKEN